MNAVKSFQLVNGLPCDGIVGNATLYTLKHKNKSLTELDYAAAAKLLNVPIACVKAVKYVESGSTGFISNGKPKILFEGHVFWKELIKRGINPESVISGNEDILYKNWTKKYYIGGEKEYNRLNELTQH